MKNNFLKTIVNKIKDFSYSDLLVSAIILCIGLFLIFFSETVIHIIFIIGGILLAAFSIYRFILLFSTNGRPLLFYLSFLLNLFVFFCALAMIFCAKQTLSLIGRFIGLYLIVSNAYKLYRLLTQSKRDRRFWISLSLTSLALLLGAFLVFFPRAIAGLVSVFLGIALVYEAIIDIVFTLSERRTNRTKGYIEVDFTDKTKRK